MKKFIPFYSEILTNIANASSIHSPIHRLEWLEGELRIALTGLAIGLSKLVEVLVREALRDCHGRKEQEEKQRWMAHLEMVSKMLNIN